SCSGTRPAHLGHQEGLLRPCPDRVNCVSTMGSDSRHATEPIRYDSTMEQAKQKLVRAISSMKRSHLVADSGNYLHVEFTSLIFRFVDDVEFLFNDEEKTIHFRSASRVGYSDLGVNRKRMEEIRLRFYQEL
ncbi:MAG: DUF1499 domain-containing protein, partial [Desulfomonilia bacterium]|nr:DUF1499 domain-containing protein [Desulfomonilia bacterium]